MLKTSLLITFFIIALNPIMGSILHQLGLSSIAGGWLYYKYVYFFVMFTFAVWVKFAKERVYSSDLAFIGYFIVFFLYGMTYWYKSLTFSALIYLYIFPLIIFYVGELFSAREIFLEELFKVFQKIFLVFLVFGYLDYFWLSEAFWVVSVNYASYISEVKNFPMGIIDNLPGNFFFDPYGLKIRRYTSIFGDPLAFSYFALTMFVLFLFVKPFKKSIFNYLYVTLLLVAIGLSLTRAVIIMLLIMLVFLIPIKKYLKILLFSLIIVVGHVVIYNLNLIISSDTYLDSSSKGHLLSFDNFIQEFDMKNLIWGNIDFVDVYFEPAMYNLFFYFGILGTVLFSTWVFLKLRPVFKNNKYVAALMFSGLISMFFFSQSFLSITSSWFAWFLFGYYQYRSLSRLGNKH